MRLTQQEQKVICDSINRVDPEARILLFGSRVNDQARGGDIDLLVFSEKIGFDDLKAKWGQSIKIKSGFSLDLANCAGSALC